MFKYYPQIILLASSYKFYSILRSYTNMILSGQELPELMYFFIPRFFDFLILLSFLTLSITGKTIYSDIHNNSLSLKINAKGSIRKYFFFRLIDTVKTQIKILFASMILPIFISFFIKIDFNLIISTYIGFLSILLLASSLFVFLSFFKVVRYLSISILLLAYGLFFYDFIQDFFYGIIDMKIIYFTFFVILGFTISSKKVLLWVLHEK